MGIESGRSPGVPDRNVETFATGGCSDGKALLHSSCRAVAALLNLPFVKVAGGITWAQGGHTIGPCPAQAPYHGHVDVH